MSEEKLIHLPKGRVMPVKEVEPLVGICKRTITRWEALGRFPKHVRLGRKLCYYEADIREYIEGLSRKTS